MKSRARQGDSLARAIDKTVTELLQIPMEKVELALIDGDEFFETYSEPDYDDEKNMMRGKASTSFSSNH